MDVRTIGTVVGVVSAVALTYVIVGPSAGDADGDADEVLVELATSTTITTLRQPGEPLPTVPAGSLPDGWAERGRTLALDDERVQDILGGQTPRVLDVVRWDAVGGGAVGVVVDIAVALPVEIPAGTPTMKTSGEEGAAGEAEARARPYDATVPRRSTAKDVHRLDVFVDLLAGEVLAIRPLPIPVLPGR